MFKISIDLEVARLLLELIDSANNKQEICDAANERLENCEYTILEGHVTLEHEDDR